MSGLYVEQFYTTIHMSSDVRAINLMTLPACLGVQAKPKSHHLHLQMVIQI